MGLRIHRVACLVWCGVGVEADEAEVIKRYSHELPPLRRQALGLRNVLSALAMQQQRRRRHAVLAVQR